MTPLPLGAGVWGAAGLPPGAAACFELVMKGAGFR